MQQFLNAAAVLTVVLCGLGIMTSAVFCKKTDAFIFVRPIFQLGKRILGKTITWCYTTSRRLTASAWQTVKNSSKSRIARIACGLALLLSAPLTVALWFPAEIIGTGKK